MDLIPLSPEMVEACITEASTAFGVSFAELMDDSERERTARRWIVLREGVDKGTIDLSEVAKMLFPELGTALLSEIWAQTTGTAIFSDSPWLGHILLIVSQTAAEYARAPQRAERDAVRIIRRNAPKGSL